jgi:hypothetical protein
LPRNAPFGQWCFTVIHSSVGAWLDIYLWEPGLLAIVVCQAIHHSLTAFYRQQATTGSALPAATAPYSMSL